MEKSEGSSKFINNIISLNLILIHNQKEYNVLSILLDLKVRQHLVNLRHKHQHDKKVSQPGRQSTNPVIRSLSEIGKKASAVSTNGEFPFHFFLIFGCMVRLSVF